MVRRSLLLLVVLAGCSDGHARTAEAGADSVEQDAGDTELEVDASAASEVRALVFGLLTELDRTLETSCACLVRTGDATSQEECVGAQRAAPHWTECATRGIMPFDSAEVRAQLSCQTEQFRARNDCVAASSCDSEDVFACTQGDLQCPALDAKVVDGFGRHCSDDLPPFL